MFTKYYHENFFKSKMNIISLAGMYGFAKVIFKIKVSIKVRFITQQSSHKPL